MNKCKKEIDQLRMNEIMSRAEKIEKELGLPEEIEFSEEEMEILKAYEASKKENAQAQDYDYREEPEKNITEITDYKKKKEKKKRFLHLSQKAQRSIAMLVIGILCVGAASMTSQANRQWVVERLKYTTGNNEIVIQIGEGDKRREETIEEQAVKEAKEKIGIDMPILCYKPKGLEMKSYNIIKESNMIVFEYSDGKNSIFLRGSYIKKYNNYMTHLHGENIESKIIENNEFNIEYIDAQDMNGNKSYLAEWEYDNAYYQLIANYDEEELIKILENLLFFL